MLEEESTWAMWLYHQCNQSIHVTDGMTVMSPSASHVHKYRLTDHLCEIGLNWKLLHKFTDWCKFSIHIKAKLHKKKSYKTRPACTAEFKLPGSDGLILQFVSRYRDNASIIFINSSCFGFMHFVTHIKWNSVDGNSK